MKFGMPTLIELPALEDCAALCARLGLQFVEFNMSFPQYQPDTLDAGKLRKIARENGIFYTIHLDENMNVAEFNPYVAEGYFRTVRETIELAKQLEIPVLNLHLSRGVYCTLPEKKVFLFEQYRDRYLEQMAGFRDLCTQAIGDAPIRVCIENTDGFTGFQKDAIADLLESPVFGLTLDVGHNYCKAFADEPVVLGNIQRLHHMHLHDVAGGRDHQPLGTGEVDVAKYLDLARQQECTVLLETKTIEGLKKSAEWIRENSLPTQ